MKRHGILFLGAVRFWIPLGVSACEDASRELPSTDLGPSDAPGSEAIQIPTQADWIDHGAIARATGRTGDWNREYAGFAPCGLLKRDGRYHVYYIGSDGDRRDDGGPVHRALGVTSCEISSGYTSPQNWVDDSAERREPVLSHTPNLGGGSDCRGPGCGDEEGIFTCAVAEDGDWIHLYYGAMTNARNFRNVIDDVKVVSSKDSLFFPDGLSGTTVIDHRSSLFSHVWGRGDELDPLGVFQVGSKWHIYYSVGSGTRPRRITWGLGLASGPDPDRMDGYVKVVDDSRRVQGGMDGSNRISSTRRAFFMDLPGASEVHVYVAADDDPQELGVPVQIYDFNAHAPVPAGAPADCRTSHRCAFRHQVTFLDEEEGRWIMVYRNGFYHSNEFDSDGRLKPNVTRQMMGDEIRIKTAPVVGRSGLLFHNSRPSWR